MANQSIPTGTMVRVKHVGGYIAYGNVVDFDGSHYRVELIDGLVEKAVLARTGEVVSYPAGSVEPA